MIKSHLLLAIPILCLAIIAFTSAIHAQDTTKPGLTAEQQTNNAPSLGYLAAGLGAGLSVVGVGMGVGRLAGSAMEAIGRQPEANGSIRTSMMIASAIIEGAAFFALAICIILATK